MKRLISLLMCAVLATTPVLASDTGSESEPDSGVLGIFGNVIDFVSKTATDAGKSAQEAVNTACDALGQFGTDVSEQFNSAVSDMGNYLNGLGQNISDVAAQVQEAAASIPQDIAEQSSVIADQALTTLDGAANVVIDGTGNIVNMASEGAAAVSSSAEQALDAITSRGNDLIALADVAVTGLNLEDPENVEKARKAIDLAVESAYKKGLFGEQIRLESIQIIKDIIFGAAVYGYQYSQGIITLPEYATLMSEIIIREGLPTGVGFVASQLPVPGAGDLAKQVTAFLVQVAYGEGEEEVLFEDTVQTPEKAAR